MKQTKSYEIDWGSTLFLTLTPVLALLGLWAYFASETFNPWLLLLMVFFYYATGFSITAGYHRLFAHKAYQAHPLTRVLLILFGAGAFQNSVKKWATDHRIHHRYVDEDRDPYCIKKGFWYAHFTWMCVKSDIRGTALSASYSKDFDKDPWIMWQDKHYGLIAVVMGLGLPTLMGAMIGSWFGGLVFGGLLRLVIVHHFTFCINSLAHCWGSQPFTDENSARDNSFLAFFTYGEGFHNFHHIFHSDYRNGIRWYDWDPTKWFIKAMAYFNMAKNLRVTPDYEIFKARMKMAEKKFLRAPTQSTYLSQIHQCFRNRADTAHNKLTQLLKDYEWAKTEWSSQRKAVLKRQIARTRKELHLACRQWQVCLEV